MQITAELRQNDKNEQQTLFKSILSKSHLGHHDLTIKTLKVLIFQGFLFSKALVKLRQITAKFIKSRQNYGRITAKNKPYQN